MNTFCIVSTVVITSMIAVFSMFVYIVVSDVISNKRRERELAERDAKQRRLNNLVKDLYLNLNDENGRGFINCEYAFGRWYIQYEYLSNYGEHYSITESFYDTGIARENYSRLNTKYGFFCNDHSNNYSRLKSKMMVIINKTL